MRCCFRLDNLIILGGPGSGKTTIALIKAEKEANSLFIGQKVLFLSFARATVSRVIEGATHLIDKKSLKYIEINTYHGFFWNILRSHGYLINKNYPFTIMNAANEAVRMANIPKEERKKRRKEIFDTTGFLAFDLFASLAKELISRSKKLRKIISRSYPIIIVDEFQDTNIEEWEIIKLLSEESKIIALADPNQRIYDFRGADPARIAQFIKQLNPDNFNFENQNNRSLNTDINIFGNDLLTGKNQHNKYNDVKVHLYSSYGRNRHEMYSLKTKVIGGIKRLKSIQGWSIAVLVPTKHQMLQASNYFSSQYDNLPPIEHDVAIDSEGPELAGYLFAKLLEPFNSTKEIKEKIIIHLIDHLKGRKGNNPPTQNDLRLSAALENFLQENKIRGSRRKQLIKEIDQISEDRAKVKLTGTPSEDWLKNLSLFHHAKEAPLVDLREDARYVRLLHKGSHLRETLNQLWRRHGCYYEASKAFQEVMRQESFSISVRKTSGINIMTIHKSKGKQFNEVFLFEGFHRGRFVRQPEIEKSINQSRLTLRVGITRAMQKATILSPSNKPCEIL